MTQELRVHLLQLDITAWTSLGSLPGCIALYVGMPVILWSRNLCTDLGVANGSQGIVRGLYTNICEFGFTYCTCALVEFPSSQVSIPGLLGSIFPVTLILWSFTTLPAGTTDVSTKLPIQPAFAITGHSAQGKTLPNVIVDLHEGGFGAYVAASHTCSRQGLCIMLPVTIDQLNKPLPYDLLQEMKCLHQLEHNTYIRHGFAEGALVNVIDPESERELPPKKLQGKFIAPKGSSQWKLSCGF
ncbi:uncharacterized protein EDB93DRAFT_1082495 [Suillus bovinus]|uniref:uncharacterized protein n=1 Tax=Suillus bovinus TaxID=48563 RepID=UPI001B867902|nr:uncharacterized protein EDB93DRAFT_1082495 [Suillus bovinus]KAG2153441.1 hypothetical protein EDB93DRAFT_1082495 [Suillus bovinus]